MYNKFRNNYTAKETTNYTNNKTGGYINLIHRNGFSIFFYKIILFLLIVQVECNKPPRFLIDGQTEIVLRLKEGDETPVGEYLYQTD